MIADGESAHVKSCGRPARLRGLTPARFDSDTGTQPSGCSVLKVASWGSVNSSLLVRASDGNFYTMGNHGGTSYLGTLFSVSPEGTVTVLVSFDGTNGFTSWYSNPLLEGADGNFYGATQGGGPAFTGIFMNSGNGTLFRMTPDGTLTNWVEFNGTNGAAPLYGPLVQTAAEKFYGTTFRGGADNRGTVFRIQITPEPPMLKNVSQTGGGLTFTWAALTGLTYQVQFTTNLTQTNWVDLGDPVIATNTTASANDVIGPDRRRFYRVVLLR